MRQLVTPPRITREYETIYILRPDVTEEERSKVVDRFEGIIEKLDGYVLRKEEWGKRRLAYRIQKQSHGTFLYYRFLGYPDLIGELERNLRILEPVLKYLTVRLDEVDRETRIAESADGEFPSTNPDVAKQLPDVHVDDVDEDEE